MPLISVEEVAPGVRLGLWRIDETVEDFFRREPELSCLRDEIGTYGAEQRRIEVLAVRSLMLRLVGSCAGLCHDVNGRPYLAGGMNIGVSHTKGCAAVIVSPERRVSVDVEYMSERVGRVARRLLRPDEKADTLTEKLLHWCTKETLYKLYSDDRLALSEIRLLSIAGDAGHGTVTAENIRRNERLDVFYRIADGFVVTYVAL